MQVRHRHRHGHRQCRCDRVGVRECGTRQQGCDESPGWVWSASTFLETYLLENLDRLLILACPGKLGSAPSEDGNNNAQEVILARDDDAQLCSNAAGTSMAAKRAEALISSRYETDAHESVKSLHSPPVPSVFSSVCRCRHNPELWHSLKVLELGSGTGWLALRLAAHGASVTATDRVGTLPLLAQNVVRNQEAFSLLLPSQGDDDDAAVEACGANPSASAVRGVELNVTVAPLEWKVMDENDNLNGDTSCLIRTSVNDVSASDLGGTGGWDAVVASDVLYLNELYADLLQTLREQCLARDALLRLKEHGGATDKVGCPTVVVMAWEERRPQEEARFVELAADVGFVFSDGTPRVVGANAATQNRMWVLTMTLGPRSTAGAGSDINVPYQVPSS
jgi:predicted nicotinamide N-methyase